VLPEKYNEVDTGKTKDESNQFVEFTLGSDQQAQLEQAVKSGLNVLICDVKISEGSLMKSARACLILNYFNELGTVIYTDPDVLEAPDDAEIDKVSYLVITQMDASTFEAKSRDELMDIDEVKVVPFYGETLQNYKQPKKAQQKETDIDTTSKTANYEKRVTQTVRVDVERLEKMMNLVGELVIEQARILQVGNILHNRYSSDEVIDDLLGISNRVSRVIGELQEGVMKSRMLPIQQLFNRFPRMVRDLSESLNKQVELILEGGDTEMDRTIIEEITDPLIHLIRNAIDHGIETPDIRKKTGKPLKGMLRIIAFHQENHVILTIEDDGRGIDLRKVKQAAVKKQIITSQDAENLTEQEVINLIFHTGFSTSQTVNDISGRGVGMDIVRNHVDRLNGIIDVETKQGEGTKFTIKLPLTLAILTGLLVKINDETYALPMSNVIEIVRKPEREIEFVKGQAVSVIREKVLPLIWLHDYFNIPRRKRRKNVFIVVLGVAEKRLGLVVDELVGNQEVVVKPLGTYIGKIEGFSGATILGDGSVACILDVVGISKMVSSRKVTVVDDYQNCDIEVGNR
jgi:two-component system chemotaxis sensor kinase CheA